MGESLTEGFVCSNLSDDLSGLSFKDLPIHSVEDDSVKISIKAASLNFPDLLMTQGKYQNKPELPFALGMDTVTIDITFWGVSLSSVCPRFVLL